LPREKSRPALPGKKAVLLKPAKLLRRIDLTRTFSRREREETAASGHFHTAAGTGFTIASSGMCGELGT